MAWDSLNQNTSYMNTLIIQGQQNMAEVLSNS